MNELLPFLRIYRQNSFQLLIGLLLAFLALIASICLLAVSGWFISATALAGMSILSAQTFDFFTPGASVRGFSILRTAARYFERLVNHDATFRLLTRLRVTCYTKLEPLSPTQLSSYRQGDILNRLVADVDTLDHLYLRLVSPFICAIAGCFFMVLIALYFSTSVAIYLSSLFLISIMILPPIFYFLGNSMGETMSETISHLRICILDYIGGYTDLCVSGAQKNYQEAITQEEQKLYNLEEKMAHYAGLAKALVILIGGVTLLLILFVVFKATVQHTMDGPTAAMLVLGTLASFESIIPLPLAMQALGKVKRSAKRVNELIQQKPDVAFQKQSEVDLSTLTPQVQIVFKDLTYQYANQPFPVLKQLNLCIEAGEKVAITGHTGCGKSTLINLLTRTDNINSGEILFNGKNIDRFCESDLRKSMSVMPQRIHIFSGTLRDNLLLANFNASDQQLHAILEDLGLSWPGVSPERLLNTWVGEGGRTLSGGEARRIGVARTVLQDAPIVLLDEPTEGLDIITEKKVLTYLANYYETRTVLVATHKPAILSYMNSVIAWQDIQQG